MTAVLVRVLLAPLLVGGSSLVVRKWGAAAGGWLLGLPLLSGPISLILLTERGQAFASAAAAGTLLGMVATAAFCAAYALASRRWRWWGSLAAGYGAFAVAAVAFSTMRLTLGWSLVLASAALGTLAFATRHPGEARPVPEPPKWDMPVRMAVTGLLVVALSVAAGYLGPAAAGLLAPIPVLGAIMATFTHRRSGPEAARRLMHGAVVGSWGGVAFFAIVVWLLGALPPAEVYLIALAVAALTGALAARLSVAEERLLRLRGASRRGVSPQERSARRIALESVARSS